MPAPRESHDLSATSRSFLEELERWRARLGDDIVCHNAGITERALNEVVQRTIDRIVFLRVCEDRGIEPYQQLYGITGEDDVYAGLLGIFARAEERYNAGPFQAQGDASLARLSISAGLLRDMLQALYYPQSPFQLSALPLEILGQVYEQFLGQVIRIRDGRATVEARPEVRKAGGVYYTPVHIVEYVVQETLGRVLASKKPRQADGLRVLDPACGSGLFLLCAFKKLLGWYLDKYQSSTSRTLRQRIYRTERGRWRLTIKEKKRILNNHIFGVDIDPQAVEVTRLSLLLQVLEGESDETLSRQRELFHERVLPELSDNIKCGNSLVSGDFMEEWDDSGTGEDGLFALNPFVWSDEFPAMEQFDVVVGNPPWGQKGIMEAGAVKAYLRRRYPSSAGIYDLFRPFVEKSIELVKPGGHVGMVLPDIILLKNYQETRALLLERLALSTIDWWGMAFPGAVIDAVTLTGARERPPTGHTVRVHVRDDQAPLQHEIPQRDFVDNPRHVFNLYLTPERRAVVRRLATLPTLGEFFEVHEGVHSGNMRRLLFVTERADDSCRPMYFGRDEIAPYHLTWRGRYVRLSAARRAGQAAPSHAGKKLYANLGQSGWYAHKKLLIRRTGDYVLAAPDDDGYYASNNFFIAFVARACSLDLNGLCALLNSRFITWYFRTVEPRKGRVFAELKIKHINAFPLPRLIEDSSGCAPLNRLGAQRRALADELANARSIHERDVIERRALALDSSIDDLIGALYELSVDETRLIAG